MPDEIKVIIARYLYYNNDSIGVRLALDVVHPSKIELDRTNYLPERYPIARVYKYIM